MPNLMIIYDNAADRATTTGASTTAGTLIAAYMRNDRKGQAHRSAGTSVSYTLTWATDETIGAVALPATNLSATATIRARLYNSVGTLIADSGVAAACAGLNLGRRGWVEPRNVNAFAQGGASKTGVWLGANYTAVRSCVIDLVDGSNPAGYIDCARLVVGSFWSPLINAAYGVETDLVDTTESVRNDAGDDVSDIGTMYETMKLNLQSMAESDRATMLKIVKNNGTSKNMFISLLPGDASSTAEQDYMIFGKRNEAASMFDYYKSFSRSLDIRGW